MTKDFHFTVFLSKINNTVGVLVRNEHGPLAQGNSIDGPFIRIVTFNFY